MLRRPEWNPMFIVQSVPGRLVPPRGRMTLFRCVTLGTRRRVRLKLDGDADVDACKR